jgi:hypothetical protein
MVPHTVINEGGLSCAVASNLINHTVASDSWKKEKCMCMKAENGSEPCLIMVVMFSQSTSQSCIAVSHQTNCVRSCQSRAEKGNTAATSTKTTTMNE